LVAHTISIGKLNKEFCQHQISSTRTKIYIFDLYFSIQSCKILFEDIFYSQLYEKMLSIIFWYFYSLAVESSASVSVTVSAVSVSASVAAAESTVAAVSSVATVSSAAAISSVAAITAAETAMCALGSLQSFSRDGFGGFCDLLDCFRVDGHQHHCQDQTNLFDTQKWEMKKSLSRLGTINHTVQRGKFQ